MCFALRHGRKTRKPNIALEFILEKCYLNNIFTPNFNWEVITGVKLGPPLLSLYIYIYIYINKSLPPMICYEINLKMLLT